MLDLKKCHITTNLGIMEVYGSSANFESGSILQKVDDSGTTKLTVSDGTNPAGVAKWDHMTGMIGVVIMEAITFPAGGGANSSATLSKSNLVASMYKVEDAAGSDYTETTHYTMNTTNGIVTRVDATTTIPDAGTVYVTYKYNKTDAQIDAGEYPNGLIGGRNLRNSLDDVAGSNRMTLIQAFALIYTTCYDSSLSYTVGEKLYGDANGLFTNVTVSNPQIGSVHEVPSADDTFMGIELQGFTPGT
jgi:hypothetical protein